MKLDKHDITRDITSFRLSSADHRAVDTAIVSVVKVLKAYAADFYGPIPLPVRARKRPHPTFIRAIHLFASDETPLLLRELQALEIPQTVDISIKQYTPDRHEYTVRDRGLIYPAKPLKKEPMKARSDKPEPVGINSSYYARDRGQFGSFPLYEQDE